MWQRNDGAGESNVIQNIFTAYLVQAVRRKKIRYLGKKEKRRQYELALNDDDQQEGFQSEMDLLCEMPLLEKLENYKLQQVLSRKSERDLYIFFARVLEGNSFFEIAEELGMGYTAVKNVYYRMIKKARKELDGERK